MPKGRRACQAALAVWKGKGSGLTNGMFLFSLPFSFAEKTQKSKTEPEGQARFAPASGSATCCAYSKKYSANSPRNSQRRPAVFSELCPQTTQNTRKNSASFCVFCGQKSHPRINWRTVAERPKLSDPAHGTRGLQPERDGRVRCSAWLGITRISPPLDA